VWDLYKRYQLGMAMAVKSEEEKAPNMKYMVKGLKNHVFLATKQ